MFHQIVQNHYFYFTRSIAYFIGNTSAKNYQNRFMYGMSQTQSYCKTKMWRILRQCVTGTYIIITIISIILFLYKYFWHNTIYI